MSVKEMVEQSNHHSEWTITRYADRSAYLKDEPFDISIVPKNVLLNEGINELLLLLVGSTESAFELPFNRTNSYLGAGNNTGSSGVATSTALLAASSGQLFVQCSTGYPKTVAQTVTWRGVFTSLQANYNWREFSVRNGSTTTAQNLNRRVSNQGTKVEGQTWTLDLSLTIS